MAVTLKQIAEHVGIAPITVSYALNNKGHLRQETRDRIMKAAAELGYRPNTSAQAMRNGRFGCVTLLLSTEPHRSSLQQGIMDGVDEELARHDLHLTLARMPDSKLSDETVVPKILRQYMSDGLLINYNAVIPPQLKELIQRNMVPSIWVNSVHPTGCIYTNDAAGARDATNRLLALGHKRIAYVSWTTGRKESLESVHYSIIDRQKGYVEAMMAAGLQTCLWMEDAKVPPHQRLALARRKLSGSNRPTAVIAYGSRDALPVWGAAMAAGLTVPNDLSLISFSESVIDDCGIRLATVISPFKELGQQAVRLLLKKIERPKEALAPQVVPMSFDPGASLAPRPVI